MRFLLNPPKAAAPRSFSKSFKGTKQHPNSKDSYKHTKNTNYTLSPDSMKIQQSSLQETVKKNKGEIKAWGQQCSPNCGCTIRFEAHLDRNRRIISASYDAKTVITTITHSSTSTETNHNRSHNASFPKLQPVLTQTQNGRPLLKKCQCQTLHGLAQTITEILPKYSLSQAQNQLEYAGIRSSPAFRYTALKNLNLLRNNDSHVDAPRNGIHDKNKIDSSSRSTSDSLGEININNIPEGHCYDLVEDALIACIQGYIPKPRLSPVHVHANLKKLNHQSSYLNSYDEVQRIPTSPSENEKDRDLDPLRFVRAAKQRAKEGIFHSFRSSSSSSSSSPSSSAPSASSMPPFHFMSDTSHDDGPMDTLTQIKMEIKSMKKVEEDRIGQGFDSMANDWVTHVDEKHKVQQEKRTFDY